MNGGDVHFGTRSGVIFTFNGAGDFIYAKNKFMEIHTRSIRVPGTVATTLAAIVIKDEQSQKTLELWWEGKDASDMVSNCCVEFEKFLVFFCFVV